MIAQPEERWPSVLRHRTAISRDKLSLGARSALEDGLLVEASVLDYGCGKGHDVAGLQAAGVRTRGWDPHFAPDADALAEHDAVLLTYVLNTIEDTAERSKTLSAAFALARRRLVVTTRLASERRRVNGMEYEDGVLTSRRTFQHLFTTAELCSYVSAVLGHRAVVARRGVVYVFRDERDRFAYLSNRYGLGSTVGVVDLAGAVAFYEARGRAPEPCDGLANLDVKGLPLLLRRSADPERVVEGRRRTTIALLLFLAMERFHGQVSWGGLDPAVQADIRASFGSYKHATWRASRLLGQLRDATVLRRTMRASPGKLTPSALYVHRRALGAAPVLLRIYEECGALAAGRPASWDLVKLHHDRHMVSWLSYPDFDRDAHPVLAESYHVALDTMRMGSTDYRDSASPPVLHRKEEFLEASDARAPLYSRLTRSEVAAGLYLHPERIGTKLGWEDELRRCGRTVRGHRLVRQ